MKDKLTVVTCSMNREIYLAKQVNATKNLKNLHKHLIINWSSANVLNPELLEVNPKVEIVNVKNEDTIYYDKHKGYSVTLDNERYLVINEIDIIVVI